MIPPIRSVSLVALILAATSLPAFAQSAGAAAAAAAAAATAATQAATTAVANGQLASSATAVAIATPVPPPVPVLAPVGTTDQPAALGETSLTLDVAFGIRYVPSARVTVPSGEKLRVTAPSLAAGLQYIWTKNGHAIAGATTSVLTLTSVSSTDAGTYTCLFSAPGTLPQSSQSLVLGVGPTDRLINLSTRATLNAGAGQSFMSGFIVASGAQSKKLIVRAVGPSLALFGVANPLRFPVLRIFDAAGQPYINGYAYPAIVGGPTYESDLADSLARAGAFPIPAGTADAVVMMPFAAGSYVAQVTSGDATAGNVLLEIYEVP